MYDLRADPQGVNNLAQDLAHAGTVARLRERMMTLLREEQDPRALGQAAIFDTYQYVGGRQKGYDTWLKAQDAKLKGEAPPAEAPKRSGKSKGAKATP